MKISVVTAVYNRAGSVGEAIGSLAAQSHADWEHVVQDGGSTDGTLDILRRHGDARMALESAPDAGIYDAINRGIARAQGDVVGLLHSDDVLADGQVLARVAEALADPAVDGVYGDLDYVRADAPERIVRRWRAGRCTPAKLRRGWMPPHPTLYLRREAFARWGAYDTGFRIAADYEAILRWLVRGRLRLAYVPAVQVRMRLGGASNRSLRQMLIKSREDYRAMRRHGVGGAGTLALKNLSKLGQFLPARNG